MTVFRCMVVLAVAFVVTLATVPLAKRIAVRIDAVDYPSNRRINSAAVPRCGGIALFLGIIAAALAYCIGVRFFGWRLDNLYIIRDVDYVLLYLGVATIFTVGLVDDITQLSVKPKLLGQVVACSLVAASGVTITAFELLDAEVLAWLDYPLTVIYLLIFVNVTNLIDGLDGLAAGVVAIVSLGMFYLMLARGAYSIALACLAIVGACLGFLRYNFHPASVFMGDSGSMLLGIAVGIVSVLGVVRGQSFTIMLVPLLMAAVPVLDTVSSIVRRLRAHTSIGSADMGHIHHRLMKAGLGQLRSVLVLWACTAVLVLAACIMDSLPTMVNWIVLVVLAVPTFFVISKFGLFRPVLRHHYDNKGRFGPRRPRERR